MLHRSRIVTGDGTGGQDMSGKYWRLSDRRQKDRLYCASSRRLQWRRFPDLAVYFRFPPTPDPDIFERRIRADRGRSSSHVEDVLCPVRACLSAC